MTDVDTAHLATQVLWAAFGLGRVNELFERL